MALKPNPYKLVCPKCEYSKLVTLQSDALSLLDLMHMSSICSKCKEQMERKNTNMLDDIFSILK